MIQAYTETSFAADLSTEDNRIAVDADGAVLASTQIRFLIKFINDLDGSVDYCYPTSTIYERYTHMFFNYNATPDFYAGELNLLPSGHWKYEVYEVAWKGTVVVASGTAPATETDVLPQDDDNGIVMGIITKGILNLTEKAGTEQVQYNQHEATAGTNTIYYGQ